MRKLVSGIPIDVADPVTSDQKVLQFIVDNPDKSRMEISRGCGLSLVDVGIAIRRLVNDGCVVTSGFLENL